MLIYNKEITNLIEELISNLQKYNRKTKLTILTKCQITFVNSAPKTSFIFFLLLMKLGFKIFHYFKHWKYFSQIINNDIIFQSLNIPREVQTNFLNIGHYCFGFKVCGKIGNIQTEDYFRSNSVHSKVKRRGRLPRSVTPPQPTSDATKKHIELRVSYAKT